MKWLLRPAGWMMVGLLALGLLVTPRASAQQPAQYENLQPDVFMTDWLVLGPVPVSADSTRRSDEAVQKAAFDADWLPNETFANPAANQSVEINGTTYSWERLQTETDVVDLTAPLGNREFAIAYARAEIVMPEETTALLGIGSDDGVKVWLNGELVHQNWIGRPVQPDADLVKVTFREGRNHLLLKVQNMQLGWGFSCRILGPATFAEQLVNSAARGNLDNIRLLLENGADINAKNRLGMTALHAATVNGREETAELLRENGADVAIPMPPPEKLIDGLLAPHIEGITPGAAILVARNGQILFEKGYGYANIAAQTPITPETKFRIGSITKQFTAAAILELQEAGRLALQDPLAKYYPDFPRGDEVTLYQLLTHTSGIHSYTNRPDFISRVTGPITVAEIIDSMKADPFDFDPGTNWAYNNSGYLLLGDIIEKVSGLSYGEFLHREFFEPLGMKNTGVHRPGLELSGEATGYSYENNEFGVATDWNMDWAGGAGALYSTVGDLFRWNEALFNGEVLSAQSLEAAHTPAVLKDGQPAGAFGGNYGFGWAIGAQRGLREISHGGGLHGFLSELVRYPEERLTVVVLANCSPPAGLNPGSLAREIAQLYLWDRMAPQPSFSTRAVDPAVLADYVGRYEYPQSAVMTVTREDGRLFAQLSGQPKFEIFPRSESEFFWKVVDAQVTFVRDETGAVTHAIHRQAGREFTAPKMAEETVAAVDPAIYDRYTGEYQLAPGAIITVTREGDKIFVQLTGQPKFEIFPRSENEFFLKVVKADITFEKDETGKVNRLVLSQAGVRQTADRLP